MSSTGNIRLDAVVITAIRRGFGLCFLDAYNNAVHGEITGTITSTISSANMKFIMEEYDEQNG